MLNKMVHENPLLNVDPKKGYSKRDLLTISDDQKVNTRLTSLATARVFTSTQQGYMGSDILENYALYGHRLGVSQRLTEKTGLTRLNVWEAIRAEGLAEGNIINISRTDKKTLYAFEEGIDFDELVVKVKVSYGRLQDKRTKVIPSDDIQNCKGDRRVLMLKAVKEVGLSVNKWGIALHAGALDPYLEKVGNDYHIKEGSSREEVQDVLINVRDSFRLRNLPSMLGVQLRGFRRYSSDSLLEKHLKLVMGEGDNSYYIFREDRTVAGLLTDLQNEEKNGPDWKGESVLKKRVKGNSTNKRKSTFKEVERSTLNEITTPKDSSIISREELLEEILKKKSRAARNEPTLEPEKKLTGRALFDALDDDDDYDEELDSSYDPLDD